MKELKDYMLEKMAENPLDENWYIKEDIFQTTVRIAYLPWRSTINCCFWKEHHKESFIKLVKKYNSQL